MRTFTAKGTSGGSSSVLCLGWNGCLQCLNSANCSLFFLFFFFLNFSYAVSVVVALRLSCSL